MTTARPERPGSLARAGFSDARRAERLLAELLGLLPEGTDTGDLLGAHLGQTIARLSAGCW